MLRTHERGNFLYICVLLCYEDYFVMILKNGYGNQKRNSYTPLGPKRFIILKVYNTSIFLTNRSLLSLPFKKYRVYLSEQNKVRNHCTPTFLQNAVKQLFSFEDLNGSKLICVDQLANYRRRKTLFT